MKRNQLMFEEMRRSIGDLFEDNELAVDKSSILAKIALGSDETKEQTPLVKRPKLTV